MKRILIALALVLAPAWAQNKTEQETIPSAFPPRVQKIVPLRYMDPVAAQNLLRDFGVDVRSDRQMKVVALAGSKAAVETAEAALKQLDVPGAAQKDFDLTVFFVLGRDREDGIQGGPIPQELQSTIAALKQTFPYKAYELLDALSLRSRAGSSAGTTGQLGSNKLTTFGVRSVNVEPDGSMIRIEGLHAGVRSLINVEAKTQYVDVSSVSTDVVDVKEGQKLVIGRSSLDGPNRALFLVMIARVAQ
jgi:hypothetical protein